MRSRLPASRPARPALLALALTAGSLAGCGGDGGEAQPAPPPMAQSCQPLHLEARDGDGPAALLDGPAFAVRPAGFGIDPATAKVDSVQIDGRPVHVLRVAVTTFEDRFGRDWVHELAVLAPHAKDLAATDAAAFSAGVGTLHPVGPDDTDPVWGTEHPEWFAGTDTAERLILSYGRAALDLGIPFAAADVVPAEIELDAELAADIRTAAQSNDDPCDDDWCQGPITNDDMKMACLMRAALVRQDLSLDPYLNLAVAESRLIDAAEAALEALYAQQDEPVELSWSRVWAVGSSKRGNTQRLAAALDERIQGVQISAADVANFPAFAALQLALWPGAYSFEPKTMAALLGTAFGEQYLRAFDMARWKPSVLDGVDMTVVVGTRDPLYPHGTILLYAEALPAGFHSVLVPNYGHGQGTVDHVGAFRALLAQGLDGKAWPRVEARWDVSTAQVQATSDGDASAVELWCSESWEDNSNVKDVGADCTPVPMHATNGTDLRHALWARHPMTPAGERMWSAPVPDLALSYPACFVRAQSAQGWPATSLPLFSAALCQAAGLGLE
ncbi:MAG: hypothetical protein HY744_33300 [Deltaproteobacteria bacterium]|nr:hypothetical protein [Deltaproteobacteria bacterium]